MFGTEIARTSPYSFLFFGYSARLTPALHEVWLFAGSAQYPPQDRHTFFAENSAGHLKMAFQPILSNRRDRGYCRYNSSLPPNKPEGTGLLYRSLSFTLRNSIPGFPLLRSYLAPGAPEPY